MIDTTALTALISASRAEVAQSSISPEKVEGADADLLAISVPDSNMSDFTVHIAIWVGEACGRGCRVAGLFSERKEGKVPFKTLKVLFYVFPVAEFYKVIHLYICVRYCYHTFLIFKNVVVYLLEPFAVVILLYGDSLSHQNTVGKGVCICCKQPVYLLFNLLLLAVV